MTKKVINFTERLALQKKKESIAANIHQIHQDIMAYKISNLPEILSLIIDDLQFIIPELSEKDQKLMNEILELLNTALEVHDYLLFSDVLEFELLRFIRST